MLKLLHESADLLAASEETKNFPKLLLIHYSIYAKINRTFPEIDYHNFVYSRSQEAGENLWISIRKFIIAKM